MREATGYFGRVFSLLASIEVTDATSRRIKLDSGAADAVQALLDAGRGRHKVMLVGNGGSASIAGHMEMDLVNRAHIRALVFNDPPVLTALSNDHGYEVAFERLVQQWADPGDVLVAISSSGQSKNILRAVHAAKQHDCRVVTFSGFDPANPLRAMGQVNFYVASRHYGEVEVAHHALGHYLTDCAVDFAQANPEDLPAPQLARPGDFTTPIADTPLAPPRLAGTLADPGIIKDKPQEQPARESA